jgi:hypothetical protein
MRAACASVVAARVCTMRELVFRPLTSQSASVGERGSGALPGGGASSGGPLRWKMLVGEHACPQGSGRAGSRCGGVEEGGDTEVGGW